jgi:hypothetical protein
MNTTKNNLITIENSTRYNTADIVAVFNALEDCFTRAGLVPTRDEDHAATADVVDFNPASVRYVVSEYNHTTHTSSKVYRYRYVKNGSWALASRNVIGLVPPEKLYPDPLEALTRTDDKLAPPEMGVQLLDRAMRFYTFYRYETRREFAEAVRDLVKSGKLPIRIEAKRAGAKISDIKRRKAAALAQGRARGLEVELKRIREELGRRTLEMANLLEACNAAGLDYDPDFDAIRSTYEPVDAAVIEVVALLKRMG